MVLPHCRQLSPGTPWVSQQNADAQMLPDPVLYIPAYPCMHYAGHLCKPRCTLTYGKLVQLQAGKATLSTCTHIRACDGYYKQSLKQEILFTCIDRRSWEVDCMPAFSRSDLCTLQMCLAA